MARSQLSPVDFSWKKLGALNLICFSHLRWDFVLQRPQHLMARFARAMEVIFWEEPEQVSSDAPASLRERICPRTGVCVVTPQLPEGLDEDAQVSALRAMLSGVMGRRAEWVKWYYTPMMLPFSREQAGICTVYDCMDELANFRFAPANLLALERELLSVADVVFTGGYSLYEAKRAKHRNVHAFPSSIDRAHFAKSAVEAPRDQAALPGPRLGYYGVIDERIDLALVDALAAARPTWSIVMVGPLAKIAEADLPRRANLHYLGGKDYAELPAYLAGWDVALMPFAINEATRFISPTKTPEYLAGGKPVVSTPIRDVVRSYGHLDAVKIAPDATRFIAACETQLALPREGAWRLAVERVLAAQSWDKTAAEMAALVANAIRAPRSQSNIVYAPAPSRRQTFDALVVGAGFAGAVLAERLARKAGKRVLVIDKREHIGGNAFDETDAAGVLMHRYGPHIFHTNSDEVFAYLSQFTSWRPYEHRVRAVVDGQQVPIPINRTTLNALYGLKLQSDAEAAAFLARRAQPVEDVRTSEDVVVSAVGRELYEKFFRGYTRKQWGMDPSELDKSVAARVPTRTNVDDRYFTDKHQAMPKHGYTELFRAMLDHPLITVDVGQEFERLRDKGGYDRLIYTGPIDAYFNDRYGKLPYRSLNFRHETLDQEWFQSVGTVNYPSEDVPYTRITEYKHLTGQRHAKTTITYEFPCADGDPFYPVPRPENHALYKRYAALAAADPDVIFVGRLASYRYYNMDQVVGQALATFRRLADIAPRIAPAPLGAEARGGLAAGQTA